MWLRRVEGELAKQGTSLDVTWRHFLLDQVNSKEGPEWKIWEQPEDRQGKGMLAQRAGEAARKQGREAFEEYHLALLVARHGPEGRRISLNEKGPLLEVAREAGLDARKLERDMADSALLEIIGNDHTEAVRQYGVFGTPTFVFESGQAAYLKMFVPPPEDTISLFMDFTGLMSGRPYLGEVKRPQPPWPKGAVRPPGPSR